MFDPAAPENWRGTLATQPLAQLVSEDGRGRRVVVTGASGFVGSHACRALAATGWQVLALVRNAGKAAERLGHMPVDIRVGDLLDPAYVRSSIDGASAVVHLAAVAIERDGDTYKSVNVGTTRAIIDAALAAGVARFVYMSQNGADSASRLPFLKSKGIAQDLVTESTLQWTVLRPSVIFGPEDEFINVIARLVRLTPFILPLPSRGNARFQPVAVDDVATVITRALADDDTVGHLYPLGGAAELSLREIAETVLVAMDAHRAILGLPTAALRPFVAALWHLVPRPPVTTGLLDTLALDNTVPLNTITSTFGVSPTPFGPDALRYLRRITVSDALRSLFRD
ncbi:MAG: complex I NDUFA9 subunit family protein [Gemmatimonadaceae bacterium]